MMASVARCPAYRDRRCSTTAGDCFADGSQLVVPEDGLVAQPDGTYHLRLHPTARGQEVTTASGADEPLVVPVVAEELTVETRQVIRGLSAFTRGSRRARKWSTSPCCTKRSRIERRPNE